MPGGDLFAAQDLKNDLYRTERNKKGLDPAAWRTLAKRYGQPFYAEALYLLTRKRFDPEAAEEHWFKTLAHRRHLSLSMGRDVGLRVALCDYFVNVRPEVDKPLIVEDELVLQKEQSALSDELTGLYNRRFLNDLLGRQEAEHHRHGHGFALIMLDVDFFKIYNDTHGHLAGDQALADLAQILRATARTEDYIFRYGGEEFAALLPRAGRAQAADAAERLRRAVERFPFAGQEVLPGGHLTVSLGVAALPEEADTARELLAKADQALYRAKATGRNRVCLTDPERRRHPRARYQAQARFHYLDDQGQSQEGQVIDISLTGLGLTSRNPLDKERTLEIIIRLPEGPDALALQGRTVRMVVIPETENPYHHGLSLAPGQALGDYRRLVEKRLGTLH